MLDFLQKSQIEQLKDIEYSLINNTNDKTIRLLDSLNEVNSEQALEILNPILKNNNIEIFKVFFETFKNAIIEIYNINKGLMPLFDLSIYENNIEIFKVLYDCIEENEFYFKFYDVNINFLLNNFIEKGNNKIVEFLIKKTRNINQSSTIYSYSELVFSGDIPLHLACKLQNLKIVKLLIDNGADTNSLEEDGKTTLFNAIEAKKANKDIIRYLIKNGADIHKEDNSGISPLSFAESNKVSMVKVLTENMEIKLDESNDNLSFENNKKINDKILLQNKKINKLSDEIKLIKENNQNQQIEEFKNTIEKQSIEIKELQNKLLKKENETKNLIDSFNKKLEKLEKKITNQKVVKSKLPLNIVIKKDSIKKDDGVIVKRESFDGF